MDRMINLPKKNIKLPDSYNAADSLGYLANLGGSLPQKVNL
jgi:hypothetical protein